MGQENLEAKDLQIVDIKIQEDALVPVLFNITLFF